MRSLFYFCLLQFLLTGCYTEKYDFIATWGGNFVSNITQKESSWEPSLKTLCASAPQFTKVHIYAVNAHYGTKIYPGMILGNHCSTPAFGSLAHTSFPLLQCPAVALDIMYCQKRGIKVLITVANVSSNIMETDAQGEDRALMMWNLFLGGEDEHRPFGNVVLDGVDIMIRDSSLAYLKYAQTLRTLMNGDNSKEYLLSISPSASFNDAYSGPGMRGTALSQPELFDYICLFPFSSPDCTARNPKQFWETIGKWQDWLTRNGPNGPSLYLALPSADGVGGLGSPGDYVSVQRLAEGVFVANLKRTKRLKGVLIFDYSIDNAYFPCVECKKTYSELFFQALNSKLNANFKCTPSKEIFRDGERNSDSDGDDDFMGKRGGPDSDGPGFRPGGRGIFGSNPLLNGQDSSADNPFRSLKLGYFVLIVLACLLF